MTGKQRDLLQSARGHHRGSPVRTPQTSEPLPVVIPIDHVRQLHLSAQRGDKAIELRIYTRSGSLYFPSRLGFNWPISKIDELISALSIASGR
jgi:hypothetical protein